MATSFSCMLFLASKFCYYKAAAAAAKCDMYFNESRIRGVPITCELSLKQTCSWKTGRNAKRTGYLHVVVIINHVGPSKYRTATVS